jgi:hypothetical protein
VFRAMIVPALPEEPLVVLIGPGLVVLELLAENPAAFHVIHGLLCRMRRAEDADWIGASAPFAF